MKTAPLHFPLLVAAVYSLSNMPALSMERALPETIRADYQLGGAYKPDAIVTVVVRDSTDMPEPGLFNICYVNGFQSQPGSDWPNSLLLLDSSGKPVADPVWPDEYFLDISSDTKRMAVLARLAPSIQGCAEKGFQAIEFDNLDSYTRSGGRLSESDAVAFATLLVALARENGMPAGQKNSAEIAMRGRDKIGFAFAVGEECHRWDECDVFTGVYGDQVINAEYADDLRGTFEQVCADPKTPKSTILRDRMLVPKGKAGYVYRRC